MTDKEMKKKKQRKAQRYVSRAIKSINKTAEFKHKHEIENEELIGIYEDQFDHPEEYEVGDLY